VENQNASLHSTMAILPKSYRIDQAVAAMESGKFSDYSEAAKEFGVDRTSISKRCRGKTRPKGVFLSESHQCLTTQQEELLISHINKLTDRGMPPTTQIVKNLAEEIRGRPVNKNWASVFIRRKGDRLKSMYLRNIDNLRVSAEHAPLFDLFFNLVRVTYFSYIFIWGNTNLFSVA
jgi:hypothetical protein